MTMINRDAPGKTVPSLLPSQMHGVWFWCPVLLVAAMALGCAGRAPRYDLLGSVTLGEVDATTSLSFSGKKRLIGFVIAGEKWTSIPMKIRTSLHINVSILDQHNQAIYSKAFREGDFTLSDEPDPGGGLQIRDATINGFMKSGKDYTIRIEVIDIDHDFSVGTARVYLRYR